MEQKLSCWNCSHYEHDSNASGKARHICWIGKPGAPVIGSRCESFDYVELPDGDKRD